MSDEAVRSRPHLSRPASSVSRRRRGKEMAFQCYHFTQWQRKVLLRTVWRRAPLPRIWAITRRRSTWRPLMHRLPVARLTVKLQTWPCSTTWAWTMRLRRFLKLDSRSSPLSNRTTQPTLTGSRPQQPLWREYLGQEASERCLGNKRIHVSSTGPSPEFNQNFTTLNYHLNKCLFTSYRGQSYFRWYAGVKTR